MRLVLGALVLALAACTSGATTPPPATPTAPAPPSAPKPPTGDPFAVTPPIHEEELPLLKGPAVDASKVTFPAAVAGTDPEPATCAPLGQRKAAAKCGDAANAQASLAKAVAVADRDGRDQKLAEIEACFPAGLVRALRAELAPECAEAIAGPMVSAPPAKIDGNIYYALAGLTVASRLQRIGDHPPKLDPPFTKARVLDFTKGPLFTWYGGQSRAVQETAKLAASLVGYGKAVAAIEAGTADLRIVDAVRSAPLPDEIASDNEAKNVYYGQLDQALDPRKDRGRDAALVGLRELTMVGAFSDARILGARALLGKMYGGRRIDAWDGLLLPKPSSASNASATASLAASLPTFYAGMVLDPKAAMDASVMRGLAQRGVPIPMRAALRGATLGDDVKALYARARFELGRVDWRTADFDQAAALLASIPAAARGDEGTLLLACAIALRNGPDDAAELVRKAPLPDLKGMGNVAALDAVAAAHGKYAGLAAYDAAYVKEVTAPEGASADYFTEVAKRYRDAAALLDDNAQKNKATDRANAADALARAVAPAR